MSIKITTKENQAKGVFAGGAILENKPIGFPQDGGEQKPYSNLFYWANATTDVGGLIGEHPHKMFEIMSFVLEGEIEHYDSKFKKWLPLKAGDVQIIRSRGGISHAERLLKNSRIFQIWFDPNIRESMLKEASYNDYKLEDFIPKIENGISTKNYVGKDGLIEMDTEGVEIKELKLSENDNQIKLDISKIHSFYVLDNAVQINGQLAKVDDFIIVENESEINIETEGVKLFLISTPQKLSYKTYIELVNN
ncbi:MAG: pirin family protein [Vicingaceae bacterium]